MTRSVRTEEKKEAIRLRREGLPYNEIALRLKVSKSTLTKWLRNVPLTEEQIENLRQRNPRYNHQLNGAKATAQKYHELRKEYQKTGRARARQESGSLYFQGCMLYWGEGTKARDRAELGNSDVNLLRVFLSFLYICFGVPTEKMTITIWAHDDIHNQHEIEEYWLHSLGLPASCLRKTRLNRIPSSSKSKKKGKLEYGVCRITVCDTKIGQEILGAIQEYGGFDCEKWSA